MLTQIVYIHVAIRSKKACIWCAIYITSWVCHAHCQASAWRHLSLIMTILVHNFWKKKLYIRVQMSYTMYVHAHSTSNLMPLNTTSQWPHQRMLARREVFRDSISRGMTADICTAQFSAVNPIENKYRQVLYQCLCYTDTVGRRLKVKHLGDIKTAFKCLLWLPQCYI